MRRQETGFETKIIEIKRTAKVTGGGKKLSFQAIVVSGDRSGKLGMGIASGQDVPQAIEKSTKKSLTHMITVPLINGTLPYDVYFKYKSVKILLKPAKVGQGIIAGGPVKIVCELAGIRNITTKLISKTKNKIAIVAAMLETFRRLAQRYNTFYKINDNATSLPESKKTP